MKIKLSIIFFYTIFIGCDKIFDTKPSNNNNLFVVEAEMDGNKVVTSLNVTISWDEIMVDKFSHYLVEKRNLGSTWSIMKKIENKILTKLNDKIFDDVNVDYRVGVFDESGNVRWAQTTLEVPPTTYVFVPDEYSKIISAYNSHVIDDGDTVLVNPGQYDEYLLLSNKNVTIQAVEGFEQTTINGYPHSLYATLRIFNGSVEGFTVRSGHSDENGGGVYLNRTGSLKNCFITENIAEKNGGGVYLTGEASLYNNIFEANISGGNGLNLFIYNASGSIINNTFVSNADTSRKANIYFTGNNEGLNFQNNIVFGSDPGFAALGKENIAGVNVKYSLMDSIFYLQCSPIRRQVYCDSTIAFMDSTNIVNNPLFVGFNNGNDYFDYSVQSGSPCLHAGNPNEVYFNKDGSRNTMGFTGGPNAR
ncbi:MAG: hypothetical protein QF852_02990 [Candidatus Marinimicrobia bacterium]|jgi:hypothetical protein|nr:hypothetical protein [Candidatus Neomarinimicrobiota bacterium]HJL74393.1 hypothetical protein [Candidatus Neomarinimicrobiota bacterium]|tara:strand:- start:723 stop:1979 length:1257 start_codon:yes stop_codon:yes gene_type:complete